MSDKTVKELGSAEDLSMDSFVRTVIQQMFENDNDTVTMKAVLKANDGTNSELEFKLAILSINGIKTRYEDNDNGTA